MNKLDKLWVGLVLGAGLPPITLYIIYLTLTKTLNFSEFIAKLSSRDLAVNIYIWSIIPVFAVFAFFYFKKYDRAMRGIVIPTMIFTLALVIYDI